MMIVDRAFYFRTANAYWCISITFDWDFGKYGPVVLRFGDVSVHCRYTASGNQGNEPVLELVVQEPSEYSFDQIAQMIDDSRDPVHLLRIEPEED